MESGHCVDEKINKLQFTQIKESQDKILDIQNEHNTRLRILEENKTLMQSEFNNLKTSQSEQKILMLDLDRLSKISNDKMFDKILVAQVKNEEKNELKFTKIEDSQGVILAKLTEIQTDKSGKLEMSKGKMVVLGLVLVALIGIVPQILMALFL